MSTMTCHEPKCILHTTDDGKFTGELKEFSERSWLAVKEAERQRQYYLKTSKFFDIELPQVFDSCIRYHSICYKEYTAVPKQVETTSKNSIECTADTPSRTLRRDGYLPGASNTGVFKQACLFCNNERKWVKGKYETLGCVETIQSAKNILLAAQQLKDSSILVKISDQDLIAKEAKFHHSCRNAYCKKGQRVSVDLDSNNCSKTYNTTIQNEENKAFEKLKLFVKQTLVDDNGSEKLSSLHDRYVSEKTPGDQQYKPQYLCDKLMQEYPNDLKVFKSSNKDGLVLSNKNLSAETALRRAKFDHSQITETAYYLRSLILSNAANINELPIPLTEEAIRNGQNATPDQLKEFFYVLYSGKTECTDNDKVSRLVMSTSDDVVFNTTRGRIKPGKHLCLGMGLKSLTGSRKVIDIVNRFGHSVSYHTVESLETQLAEEISRKKCMTPEGIVQKPGLLTGLAWDNYDENSETLSGSGTLHDTVGICYQNITSKVESCVENVNAESEVTSTESVAPRSKRTLHISEKSLAPYRKKPKMSLFEYPIRNQLRPECLTRVERLDIFWLMNVALEDHTPMWAGWNSLFTDDPLPQQKIAYMENITLPPTRLDVVAETMRRSQKVAEECGESFIAVTYDLAVAKPAMQIQATETPSFDNIFICFGAFHIIMAYFGALGYFIDGSGGPEILTDTEVLAAGSLNGFTMGKHYNRCTRLHQILAGAFQVLHFKRFLSDEGDLPQHLLDSMKTLSMQPSQDLLQQIESCDLYKDVMAKYEAFVERTLVGDYGDTAKFWMIYVKLVSIFLRFSRACRTNNLPLFTYSLKEMCPIFFAMNRPNYARWMVRYYLNLINISKTHPEMEKTLADGALSIRRTSKAFSRIPVDMTLEQTINADAASRQTGIAAFNNSESARRRWMLTRSVRSSVVGSLLDRAGLKTKEDVGHALRQTRIKRDNEDIAKVIDRIESTMNPFDIEVNENLFCITTGKPVGLDIRNDLLQCIELGTNWKDEFMTGCFADAARFEKPIPRRKLKNFAAAAVKKTLTSKCQKILELQGTRDLFGRLLYLSTTEHIDLNKVFMYPLIPVPLSIAHIDGTMNKTDKSSLMHRLEKICTGPQPTCVDVTLVDAMFLLHTFKTVPRTFGELSKYILHLICGMSRTVHFICDTYCSPSIKDLERNRRGGDEIEYTVTGSDQRIPGKWQTLLQSPTFKAAFFKFLSVDWQKSLYATVLHQHDVYLAIDSTCYHFFENNDSTVWIVEPRYICNHEEADTRLIYHLCTSIRGSNNNLSHVVRSNDTDVLVLLLYHSLSLQIQNVWMDAGLSSHNTRRYINVTSIVEHLALATALPGLHAFTGCDYTAAFMNKGKVKPLEIMKKNPAFLKAFADLGSSMSLSKETVDTLESFVCHLYGQTKLSNVDEARYAMFLDRYAPRRNISPLSNIKGVNPGSMPPCQKVLRQKIKRTNYIAGMWKRADQAVIVLNEKPECHGWLLSDGSYTLNWFDGDQMPESMLDMLITSGIDSEFPETEEQRLSDQDINDSSGDEYEDEDV